MEQPTAHRVLTAGELRARPPAVGKVLGAVKSPMVDPPMAEIVETT